MTRKASALSLLAALISFTLPAGAFAQGAAQTYVNSIGMEFVLIPAGTFMMGADPNFEKADPDELPRHRVHISEAFYLGKYEVTQQEWISVMGENKSKHKGRTLPVEIVSWNEAQAFVRSLNQKEGHSRYRLPTEAEWEYAARAGTTAAYFFGDDPSPLGDYAWYEGNGGDTSHPVGEKRPNPWGLFDVLGNVLEMVADWVDKDYYAVSPQSDPKGPPSGEYRGGRGCSFLLSSPACRSAHRLGFKPYYVNSQLGFRLALSLE